MPKVIKIGKTGTVVSDTSILKALIDGTNLKLVVRVGILGLGAGRVVQDKDESKAAFRKRVKQFQKTGMGSDVATNADIGLAHEKGIKSKNLPRRSWLEDPLRDHLNEYFAKLGKKAIETMMLSQPMKAYENLAIVSEIIIQKGFDTNGYGKWKPLKASTIAAKGSDAILIDTAQLRNAVTTEVVKK